MSATEASRCPYCLADLESEDDPTVRCGVCLTPHHQACFREHGRCTLLGCAGVRPAGDDAAAPPRPGSLHPFLPLGKQRVERSASFLSVGAPEVVRKRRYGQGRTLELELPPVATLGARVEATLVVYSPRPVLGQGLRLVVSSYLEGDRRRVLSRMESVIVGRPHTDWLTRLKLYAKKDEELLLSAGTTRFTLGFDPRPFAWHGLLPESATELGPRQRLELVAELEAGRVKRTSPVSIRLLDGRPGPPSISDQERLDPRARTPAPPLRAAPWGPRPVVHDEPAGAGWLPIATAAAQVASRPEAPSAGAIDLAVEPLARGSRLLRGRVTLGLTRWNFAGRLQLELVAERRGYVRGKKAWRECARERVILAAGSPFELEMRGTHEVSFEVPLPAVLWGGKPSEERRVSVNAAAVGEGRPLRSERREVEVIGSREPTRRRRNG